MARFGQWVLAMEKEVHCLVTMVLGVASVFSHDDNVITQNDSNLEGMMMGAQFD